MEGWYTQKSNCGYKIESNVYQSEIAKKILCGSCDKLKVLRIGYVSLVCSNHVCSLQYLLDFPSL